MSQWVDTSMARPLSRAAELRYQQIVRAGGSLELPLTDAAAPDPELSELVECGLLAPLDARDAAPPVRVFIAVNPNHALERWTSKLHMNAVREFEALTATDVGADRLTESYALRAPGPTPAAGFHEVVGTRAINQRIGQLVAGCTREFLTLAPGPRPARALRSALQRDLDAARRVTWKTLYEPSVQDDREMRRYVDALTQAGARFRTCDRLTGRLLILDLTTAVMSAPDVNGERAACFITDPHCVAYLRGVFLRLWEQASPWRPASSVALSELQRQIAKLLLAGLDQVDIAARLGVNERTLAGHVAEMKARLGATTLFQLGAELARGTPG